MKYKHIDKRNSAMCSILLIVSLACNNDTKQDLGLEEESGVGHKTLGNAVLLDF